MKRKSVVDKKWAHSDQYEEERCKSRCGGANRTKGVAHQMRYLHYDTTPSDTFWLVS